MGVARQSFAKKLAEDTINELKGDSTLKVGNVEIKRLNAHEYTIGGGSSMDKEEAIRKLEQKISTDTTFEKDTITTSMAKAKNELNGIQVPGTELTFRSANKDTMEIYKAGKKVEIDNLTDEETALVLDHLAGVKGFTKKLAELAEQNNKANVGAALAKGMNTAADKAGQIANGT